MQRWGRIAVAVLVLAGCKGHEKSSVTREAAQTAPAKAAEPAEASEPARPVATRVEVAKLLGEYKDNEVRADAQFKGKLIQTSGVVGEIKKDIKDDIFVTVGTGALLEIPVVQCYVGADQMQDAAALSKGAKVTVQGRVEGLMMNVLVKDCEINPMMRLCKKLQSAVGAKRCSVNKDTGDANGLDVATNGNDITLAALTCNRPEKYDEVTAIMKEDPSRFVVGSRRVGCQAAFFRRVAEKPEPVPADVQAKAKAFFDAL